jgi:hypothetical protein
MKYKLICRDCIFLAKDIREDNNGRVLTFSVKKDEREKAKEGDVNFVKDYCCLKCHMGVWDEGVSPGKDQRLNRVNEINRRNKCFFFPYHSDMLFDAAKELQKREQENKQLKRSNLYTQIGLGISAIALVANAIINYQLFLK